MKIQAGILINKYPKYQKIRKYIKKLKKVVDEDFYLSYTDKGVR